MREFSQLIIIAHRLLSMRLCIGLVRESLLMRFLISSQVSIWGDVFDEFSPSKHSHNNNNSDKIQFLFNSYILAYGDSVVVFQVELITKHVDLLLMKENGVASSWTKIFLNSKMFIPREVGFTRIGEVILEQLQGWIVS